LTDNLFQDFAKMVPNKFAESKKASTIFRGNLHIIPDVIKLSTAIRKKAVENSVESVEILIFSWGEIFFLVDFPFSGSE